MTCDIYSSRLKYTDHSQSVLAQATLGIQQHEKFVTFRTCLFTESNCLGQRMVIPISEHHIITARLFLCIFLYTFRSSTVPRSDASPSTSAYHLKCFVCGQIANKGDRQKYRVSEGPRTQKLLEAAKYLMDDVYTRICDLEDPDSIFAADLFYHKNCFPNYIAKYNTAKAESENPKSKETVKGKRETFKTYVELITKILNQGRGIAISDVRDMINNDNPETDMKKNELKAFLEEEFQTNIQFCLSDSKNKSQFVYSSSVSVNDAINKVRSLDCVKNAAEHIRKVLLNVEFRLEDRFCDAQELKNSYSNTQIPDLLLTFFTSLFNVNRTMLMKESLEEDEICLFDEDEEVYHENSNDHTKGLT